VVQKEGLDNTIFIDLDLPSGFESINPGSKHYKDSVLPVLIYESSRLLVKYPALNSFFSGGNITSNNEVCIGITTDTSHDGMMVKIQRPDKMNLKEIEEELVELSQTNSNKKVTPPSDLSSITFTISDVLANGVYFFTSIIYKGNTSTLGISKFDKKLNRIMLSLTFDPSAADGKTAIAFLGELKERMESYISLQKANTNGLMCYKCMRRISEDLNNKGFIKIMTNKGEEKLICDSCLLNY
jgi:pyruvate/2-oxoglutarate dehydrogenase complex dihydrolipoamide acyltransferase (E2) component